MSARPAALVHLALTGGVAFHLATLPVAPWSHLTMSGRWPGALPLKWRWLPGLSALLLPGMAFGVAARAG